MPHFAPTRRPERLSSRFVVFSIYVICMVCAAALFMRRDHVRCFPPWRPGFLDIHHLRLGSDQCTYAVFPDGTQMISDLGELDVQQLNNMNPPILQSVPQYPDTHTRAAGRALNAIRLVAPGGKPHIDYAVVTHYHADHIGEARFRPATNASPYAGDILSSMTRVPFRVVGLIDLVMQLHTPRIFDRGTFFPTALLKDDGQTPRSRDARNYLSFREWSNDNNRHSVQALTPCASNEVVSLPNSLGSAPQSPSFRLTALKSGNLVCMNGTAREFAEAQEADENQMSAESKLSYGDFRYIETGDNEGPSLDAIVAGVGDHPVDIVTPGHHVHGMPEELVTRWRPSVFVSQTWCADHTPEEQVRRMLEAGRVYATGLHPTALRILHGYKNLRRPYLATEGQTTVRVYPTTKSAAMAGRGKTTDGAQQRQEYEVFVIDRKKVVRQDFYQVSAER